ncbi:MAG: selenocysteine-specific translation elongation factor [Actinomycetota bacterium]
MHVIATAGHVDHGKSTLVRALTGIDPDRLAEEKERGLTIDLGFAWTELPDGAEVAFVDVPGHVRFLRNMLAGVGGVDACVFVVAAPEGWKPQSEEHLRILELLGHRHGLVVMTKVGVVDDELRELARLDIEEHLEGTFLDGAEVVEVDALDGTGLDELRAALGRLVADTPTAVDDDRPRLWIDRSFSATGSGTVVTGTLAGGSLSNDEELVVLPARRDVRVRALQSRQESIERSVPGSRTAVNLVGVSRDEVGRGDVLVRDGQWWSTTRFDASLQVLASLDHDVSRRGAYHVYLGTAEHRAAMRILGTEALEPGERGLVRIHLPVALPLAPGDRFLVREMGRDETVGGGEVLDVDPILPAATARPDRSAERVIAERGVVEAGVLALLVGDEVEPTLGRWVLSPDAEEELRSRVAAAVADAGPLGLDTAQLDELERAALDELDGIEIDGALARVAGAADPLADHPYPAALAAEPFAPPPPDGIDRGELRELIRRGEVVESDGAYFAPAAIAAAARRIRDLLADASDGVTVAEIRDALGTTRKHVLPLLAHLDGTGVTRRRDDHRIGGPRLDQVADGA